MKTKYSLNENEIKELQSILESKKEYSGLEMSRARAIFLLDRNVSVKIISQTFDLDEKYIYKLRRKFKEKGKNCIKHGNIGTSKSMLTKAQLEELALLMHKNYQEGIYWDVFQFSDYIYTQYNVAYASRESYRLIFKKIGFSFHKPGKTYKNYKKNVVNEWKDKHKEEIEVAEKDENTAIICEDEMILTSKTTLQSLWLPKGKYPKIIDENIRKRKVIFGFLDLKTKKAIAFKKDVGNEESCLDTLKAIYEKYKENKKIILIWDGAKYHFSKGIKAFLGTVDNLKLVALPPYAPDENPTEKIWKKVRNKITHNKNIDNIESFSDQIIDYIGANLFNYSLSLKPV